MSDDTIIFFLVLCIIFLVVIILYQQFVFRKGTQTKLQKISRKLSEINATDSDERIMMFTENKELIALLTEINHLLEKHLKMKADYRHSQMVSKRMLSNISHDIKTPMTVILGYLEMMQMNSADEMLEKTEQKAKNVVELINQFFTLAKLESGDVDVELSAIDICESCRESILDFYEILMKNDFQVDVAIPENAIYVQGNKDALQRILSNLISNVIRYGADGKYLAMQVRVDEKVIYIDVIDKGKGIDKIFAENVFERLFTMDDSRNRKIQGNGLGLTIAKNLALQMGGNISLNSVTYKKTIFTVQLKRILY